MSMDRNDKSGTLVRWKYQGHTTLGWVSWANFPTFGARVTLSADEQRESSVPAGTYEVQWQEIRQPEEDPFPVFQIALLRKAGSRKR